MSPKTRFILCAAVLAYLGGDLFLFHGPLHQAVQVFHPDSPRSVEKARKKGIVARVHQRPISASQLDRATAERLWLEGKTLASLAPADQQAARKAALADLIESELLTSEIENSAVKFDVPPTEIDERIKRFAGRFETRGHLETAMKAQGISSEKALRDWMTAQLREEKFIQSKIDLQIQVSEEDTKKWFTENQKALETPERIEARHIFAATLETPPEQAKQKLDAALAALITKQKDFATLAKELSEDPANKETGGNLGWMTRQRLAPDFAEPVFGLATGQPTLVRTKIGWHLIEVTARKTAEPRTFEDAKPEILAALEAVKRRDAIRAFRENLRQNSSANVRIYEPDLLP